MAIIDKLAEELAIVRKTDRPSVTLSYAQSLDGSITARRGIPLNLSGSAALGFTHEVRAMHDAILVGIGTVVFDDPRLTARDGDGELFPQQPQPVVLDSRLRFPYKARLLQHPRKAWIATTEPVDSTAARELEKCGARILGLPDNADGRVDLIEFLKRLGQMGIRSIMVEGGASVITEFLKRRLVDRVALTIAPLFVGGLSGVELPVGQSMGSPAIEFPRLAEVEYERKGEDLIVWGKIA